MKYCLAHVVLITTCCSVGCGSSDPPPSVLTAEDRGAAVSALQSLGAKKTAEFEDTSYLSLKNVHVEVMELGLIVESSPKTAQDVRDFAKVGARATRSLIPPEDVEAFNTWLRQSLSRRTNEIARGDFNDLQVSLSQRPLRMHISRKPTDTAQ